MRSLIGESCRLPSNVSPGNLPNSPGLEGGKLNSPHHDSDICVYVKCISQIGLAGKSEKHKGSTAPGRLDTLILGLYTLEHECITSSMTVRTTGTRDCMIISWPAVPVPSIAILIVHSASGAARGYGRTQRSELKPQRREAHAQLPGPKR